MLQEGVDADAGIGSLQQRGWQTQARLAKLLAGCRVLAPGEPVAKHAGVLLGLSKTTDAVDAIVVATAVALRAAFVTSDFTDMSRLVGSAEAEVEIPHPGFVSHNPSPCARP